MERERSIGWELDNIFFFHVIRVDRVGLQEGFGSAEEGEEL